MDRTLARQRCFNHAEREAIARCPECRRYFCRECVTEHDARLLCADCIRNIEHLEEAPPRFQGAVTGLMGFAGALLLIWTVFYFIGSGLLLIPDVFHDGVD